MFPGCVRPHLLPPPLEAQEPPGGPGTCNVTGGKLAGTGILTKGPRETEKWGHTQREGEAHQSHQ